MFALHDIANDLYRCLIFSCFLLPFRAQSSLFGMDSAETGAKSPQTELHMSHGELFGTYSRSEWWRARVLRVGSWQCWVGGGVANVVATDALKVFLAPDGEETMRTFYFLLEYIAGVPALQTQTRPAFQRSYPFFARLGFLLKKKCVSGRGGGMVCVIRCKTLFCKIL